MHSMYDTVSLPVLFCFCSGPAWFAEMALEHQPAPAEPVSAYESGRRRGGQGVYAISKTSAPKIYQFY